MRLGAFCLLLITTLSCYAEDASEPAPALVSVSGQGVVAASPDMATVTVGVMNQSSDAASAVAANNQAMAALNEALDDFDIEERDRRTQGFSLQPRYDHRRITDGTPEITGYVVTNRLIVRVRDLDDLGDLLGTVIKSGSNSVNSLQFGNSGAEELLDEARQLAVANALHKASLYAREAGGQVGRIVTITEAGVSTPRPEQMRQVAYEMATTSIAAVPISAGENEFRAVINVVFEFEQ